MQTYMRNSSIKMIFATRTHFFPHLPTPLQILKCLNVKTHRPETIIATDHRTHGVLHPPIVEVAFATRKRLHERTHRLPCRGTQPFRTTTINGNPLLSFAHSASMLNGVFESLHQVGVNRLPHSRDAHFVQRLASSAHMLTSKFRAKVQKISDIYKIFEENNRLSEVK